MSRIVLHCAVASALTAIALAGSVTEAQTARSGGGANAQLLQQMQQLASDRTSLQAELDRTKKELDSTRKERDDLKKGQQAIEQRAKTATAALAQTSSQRASTEQELTQTKAKMQELITKFRETLQTLRDVETQSTVAKRSLAAREQELKTCVDHNQALYNLNGEVLTYLEHESSWSRMERGEPFTKIKRVQLENLADNYKARADDEHINPASAPPAPQPTAPQSSPVGQGAAAPQATPAPAASQPDGGAAH